MLDNDDEREGAEGGKEEWEILGLEKRIDYENLQRVFERLDLNVRTCENASRLAFIISKTQATASLPALFLIKAILLNPQQNPAPATCLALYQRFASVPRLPLSLTARAGTRAEGWQAGGQ
jgi:hypothetical protein